jgi:hypothetical protein
MRLVDYHTDEGHRIAIVGEPGRKYLHVVFFDPLALSVTKVPLDEARYMKEIERRPRIKYSPLKSTALRWLKIPASDEAKAIVKQAAL